MSYKCAVFGHKYGEVDVDRERTEDGDEVIVTVRETETCKRCGETRVVSENKEVRTMETAADIVADDLDEEAESTDVDVADDREDSQPTPTEAVQQVAEEPSTPNGSPDTPADAVDPEEDDAVILDDGEDEEPTRETGEWPEEAAADAEQESTESEGESSPEWPEEHDEDDDASWELPGEINPHPETEQTGNTGSGTLTIPEGKFYCPNCEFRTPVESSSLRAGDFCPECHKGALEHGSAE
jgi:uncharacterized protein with FMN-binding domain